VSNDPKTALITGGAQRIGQALVNHFHDLDWRVIIHYHTSSDAADQLTRQLNGKRQDSARAFSADLGTIDQIEALAKAVTDLKWPLDLVIHNAAQFSPTPLSTTTESSWEHLMSTNLKAPFFLTQALLKVLSPRANLIFLCDIFGDRPLPNYSVYSATKAGLAMMTRSLALDLAPAHRVNGIALGAILPPSIAASAEPCVPQDVPQSSAAIEESALLDSILARVPLATIGSPVHIAEVAEFLASSDYITGQIIPVDGGRRVG